MITSQRYITTRLIMITSQRYITTKTNHDNKSKILRQVKDILPLRLIMITCQRY